ncbi:MAG: hypothetical protein ACRD9R_11345 [Pyrinomonadaceae bacterium]
MSDLGATIIVPRGQAPGGMVQPSTSASPPLPRPTAGGASQQQAAPQGFVPQAVTPPASPQQPHVAQPAVNPGGSRRALYVILGVGGVLLLLLAVIVLSILFLD